MGIIKGKKIWYHLIIFILTSFFFSSCIDKKGTDFSKENAMQKFLEMSPISAASFYAKERKNYQFLDQFYRDSILPAIALCSYRELKGIKTILRFTPVNEVVDSYFKDRRAEYLDKIQSEIINNTKLQKEIFENEVYPLLKIELDSMLNSDITNVMNKYSGGFLNYKKLEFFIGKNSNDFKRIWNENVDSKNYSKHINRYIYVYLDSICQYQKQYLYSITGRKLNKDINLNVPDITINVSSDILKDVNNYTSGEKKTMTKEFIKDYAAPIVVGAVTGGVGSVIYEMGNYSYDIYDVYNNIKNKTVSPEEQLIASCVEKVCSDVEKKYFEDIKQMVFKAIDDNNRVIFNFISMVL